MVYLYILTYRCKGWNILVLFILIVECCIAQENIRFERISVNEGLSQSDVRSFVQDKFGFLWIGTRDGLSKYDGLKFRRYSRENNNPASLYFNQILDLEIDPSGNIWIGSTGGISVYNYKKDNFQNFYLPDGEFGDADVNHILIQSDTAALLSTSKGLVSFDLTKRKFFIDPNFKSFQGLQVLVAQQIPEQGLWIGTSKGAFVRTTTGPDWAKLLLGKSIHHIHFDSNGKIYLSASNGLFTYAQNTKDLKQVALPTDPTSVIEVRRMHNGDLWVASNKVVVLDKNDVPIHVLEHDKLDNFSLSENRARVLFQTHDDVIWVGTFGYGLNKFNPDVTRFSYLNERTAVPLTSNYVSTIFTQDDTTIWVGTSRGLDVVNLRTKSAQHFSSNHDLFQIFKVIDDQDGNVWVTTSSGLMLYSGSKLIPKFSLGSIYDLKIWDDTNLILASRLGGIYLFDRKTSRASLFIPSSELKDEVSSLLAEDDYVWIGCRDGLRLYDKKGKLRNHFRESNQESGSLHASFVKSVYRDRDKNLWVGTWGGGLSMLNTADSTFTTFNTSDDLPNNVVYGILEDNAGIFWLSTNLGLSAFSPKDHTFKNFDFTDGLQSNEFNTGAYFKSASGRLYFGGINGLTVFNPEEVLVPHSFPTILPTSVTVNNKLVIFQDGDSSTNVLLARKLKSKWTENNTGVEFTAIDFKNASTRHFQYSLGTETWYDIGNRRSLELLDLPSGSHEILMRTSSPDGRWSDPVVLLSIYITPPIWERVWFRIIALLAVLAIGLAAYRYRVAHLQRMNIVLNRLVAERTKEIQTKNEEIAAQNDQLHEMNNELQTFSYSVSHDLRSPLRSIIGYSKMIEEDYVEKLDDDGRKMLRVIQQNASRMNNLINDLLEFSKLGNKEPQKFEVDSNTLVNGILDQIGTSTHHKAEIRIMPLPMVLADSNLLSQVWINLVSNAIKYSAKKDAPVIEIGSRNEPNEIIFYIKDNGAGFDMKYVDKLFFSFQRLHKTDEFEGTGIGLSIVQRIVTQHGGRVWAEGKVNEGATFYFSLRK